MYILSLHSEHPRNARPTQVHIQETHLKRRDQGASENLPLREGPSIVNSLGEEHTCLRVQATWFRAHRLPGLCEGECKLGGHGALPDPSLS